MTEITHILDEHGHYVQIVSASRLRRILQEQGEDLSRPDSFGIEDEWDVDTTDGGDGCDGSAG